MQLYVEYISGYQEDSQQFIAGQQVQARVILELSKPMKARYITVHVRGKAESHWTKTRTKMQIENGELEPDVKTVHYHSEEVYLNHRQLLWESPDKLITAGRHQFPFAFTLPADAPPNYEGPHGHIRYTTKVKIDRIWRFDKKISFPFDVAALVDLNSSECEWALSPVDQYMQEKIGLFNGKLGVEVRLPQSGFVPGEEVPIDVEVDNRTTKKVRRVSARLMQETTFFAQGQTRSKSRIMAEVEAADVIGPKSKDEFQLHLVVPSCEPSLDTEVIDVDYTLEVKAKTNAWFDSSCSVRIPLLIGTIPIRQKPPPPGFCIRL